MTSAWGNSWAGAWGNAWGLINSAIVPQESFYYSGYKKRKDNPPILKKAIIRREELEKKLEIKQNQIFSIPIELKSGIILEKIEKEILRLNKQILANEKTIKAIVIEQNKRFAEMQDEEEFLMLIS
jgi:hypothetical protein